MDARGGRDDAPGVRGEGTEPRRLVEVRQESERLKRKQADQVLLAKELEPMNAQEEAAKKENQWASALADASGVAPEDQEEENVPKRKPIAPGGKKPGAARKATPPPSKRAEQGGAPTTTKRVEKNATKRVAAGPTKNKAPPQAVAA